MVEGTDQELTDRLGELTNRYESIIIPIEKDLKRAYHIRNEIADIITELDKRGVVPININEET